MYLESLHLENFRCYGKLDITFEKKLTVIVGENGKGKIAIFDGIALGLGPFLQHMGCRARALSGRDARRVPVYDESGLKLKEMDVQYPVVLELEAVGKSRLQSRLVMDGKGLTQEENFSSLKLEDKAVLPVLAYYGTSRMWVDSRLLSQSPNNNRLQGYEECLEPSSSYNTFGKWFAGLRDQERQRIYVPLALAINKCLESTGFKNLKYHEQLQTLVIDHADLGELIVDDMSDGFRAIISMVADLAYRMVCLNPQLGVQAVEETSGLVLIDEIEMHLHPLWQQHILSDLQRAFPKVQFIITTHSSQVLSSVPAESIRVLNWDREFLGVDRVEFSLGAESHQLLQDIQKVSARPQSLPIVQDLQRYLELVGQDKWDSKEALELRQRLDRWAKGREPALIRADMDIRMREFRRRRS